ncbi:hypothetical protein HanXRQr2_Chr08g0353901 [Helianthus annuus]|uniref:Uncharacterized protein n=1 Tax=Helianthus annuus TaxID=4232 RepID=A0A9K3NEM9_HELAN|nr:hypothetical protein HanXRQr2_Chr08g0353901 [Helianthus annuus]
MTGICQSSILPLKTRSQPHLLRLHSSKLIAQKLCLREREKTCGVGSPALTRGICGTWLYGVEITEGIRRVWWRSLWRLSGVDNGEEVCTGRRHSGNSSGAILDGVEILSTTAYASTLSTRHSYFAGHIAYFVRRNAAGYILVYNIYGRSWLQSPFPGFTNLHLPVTTTECTCTHPFTTNNHRLPQIQVRR